MQTTTYSGIRYKRSPNTLDVIRQYYKDEKRMQSMADAEFGDGSIIFFSRPFCLDVYIELFGGEKTYFFTLTGGHGVSAMLVESTVDSMPKVLFSDQGKDAKEELLRICNKYLPSNIVFSLEQKGVFK